MAGFITPASTPNNANTQKIIYSFSMTGAANKGPVGFNNILAVSGYIYLRSMTMINTAATASSGGLATMALGTSDAPNLFVGATTVAALNGAPKLWTSTTPSAVSVANPAGFKDILILGPIGITVAVEALTAGDFTISVTYDPLIAGSSLAPV